LSRMMQIKEASDTGTGLAERGSRGAVTTLETFNQAGS